MKFFRSPFASYSTVGFVGVGNMGKHMIKNLASNGYQVVAYDSNNAVSDYVKGIKNAQFSPDLSHLSKNCAYIFTMLPTDVEVNHVTDEIIECAGQNSLIVDCSTISPRHSISISSKVKKTGSSFIDAPVSGGTVGAEKATLSFMVGCEKESLVDDLRPILMTMGQKVFHCGTNGSGLIAKLCNNALLAISMIGVSEVMNMGIKMGLNEKLLASIINNSTGRCWASDTNNPVPGVMPTVPSSNHYRGGFKTSLITKDLSLAISLATDSKVALPLTSLSHQLYKLLPALSHRFSDKDFAFIYAILSGAFKEIE